ncbi:MAG TPA: hypothetical protein VK013_01415 [Myxococcaceae bacterium]|nr:hypothetical protein [Myxococcaceae bacterium]
MKTRTLILSGLFAAGTLAGTALANEQDKRAQQAQQQSEFTVEGRVIEADDDDLKISRSSRPNAEFDLNRNTTITIDGQQGQARDLAPGTEVRVRFDLQEDNAVAQEVEAKKPARSLSK